MAKQSSVNLDITNNADGFSISGGVTGRTFGISGGDVTLVGSGNATVTFPTTSTTLAGLGVAQTFTALQTFTNGITANSLVVSGGTTFGSSNIKFPTVSTNLSGTSIVFTPLHNQPPASNYATIDTRNSIMVLDFDPTTDESAVFVGVVPQGMVLTSGIVVRIIWMATSATSATCRWGVQIERMNTDEDADSFDTAGTAGTTTNATSGIPNTTEITLTTIDSMASGDPFRLKVYRDADGTSGTDDMTGDAELIAVEIRSAA